MKKLIKWLKRLISNMQRLKNKFIPVAVKIVQVVKKTIDNGTFEVIFDGLFLLVPGAWKIPISKVEKFLIKRIPLLCVELEILKAVTLSEKSEEAVIQALKAVNVAYDVKKDEFMRGLAGDLANYFADDAFDLSEIREFAGKYYDKFIKNK
jgi:hypothetical protein